MAGFLTIRANLVARDAPDLDPDQSSVDRMAATAALRGKGAMAP